MADVRFGLSIDRVALATFLALGGALLYAGEPAEVVVNGEPLPAATVGSLAQHGGVAIRPGIYGLPRRPRGRSAALRSRGPVRPASAASGSAYTPLGTVTQDGGLTGDTPSAGVPGGIGVTCGSDGGCIHDRGAVDAYPGREWSARVIHSPATVTPSSTFRKSRRARRRSSPIPCPAPPARA